MKIQTIDRIKKTMGILLAVLFVVSLTASAGLASCSTCDNICPSCSACYDSCPSCSACDSSCPSCNACDNSCPSCSACDSCDACDSCHACDSCCKAKEPTWEDWFNAFKNDGFGTWSGFNFGSFGNMFNM
jgi:hypothetical protein